LTKLLIFKCLNKRSNHSELEPRTKKTPNARWRRQSLTTRRRRSRFTSFWRRTTTSRSSSKTLTAMSKWGAQTPATSNFGDKIGTMKK